VNIRSIGTCINGNASLGMGSLISEDANPVYQITAVAGDRATDATSQAAIDTIFRP
jgi:type IV pilus assembly protein PilX